MSVLHTTVVLLIAALISCNPPAQIVAPGSLGSPVNVTGDLYVILNQPESDSPDIYAAVLAALETTTVVFCKNSKPDSCEGAKTFDMTFQRRETNGFYFISSRPLNFADGSELLFLSYISNNGDKPTQTGRAVYSRGKIESITDDDPTSEDDPIVATPQNSQPNSGLNTNVLADLFKQLLGGNTTNPTSVPSNPLPTPPSPLPNPPVGTSQNDPLVPNPNNVPISPSEFEVIRLTNAERQRQGKKALIVQDKIMVTSRESSRLMKQQNNMVHGLTSGWNGENIAQGYSSPDQVVRGWINSPGHYRNMMGSFTYIGVGDTKDQGGSVYWTQQFNQ